MKLKIFIILSAIAGLALAAGNSANLSWTLATANEDGSPLAAASILSTKIVWRRPGTTTIVGSVTVPAPAITATVPNLSCGKFEFSAITLVTGSSSDETAAAAYDTKVVCKPNPPGAVAAQ
jgi:hypothetical protein